MKRLITLIAVLALLIIGTVSVLADPIHVGGGTLTAATLSPIHVGGGTLTALAKVPAHAKALGLRENGIVEPELLRFSPIHVGGGT